MTKNEYICECGHFYQDHHKQGCTVKTYSYLTEKDEFFDIQCDCSITFNQLIQKEIKTERKKILKEVFTEFDKSISLCQSQNCNLIHYVFTKSSYDEIKKKFIKED